MLIRVFDKQWNFKFVSNLGKDKDGRKYLGHCDDPASPKPCMKVLKSLTGKEALDVTLHEASHSVYFQHDESFVDGVGTFLSELLWKLGYRRLTAEQRRILGID